MAASDFTPRSLTPPMQVILLSCFLWRPSQQLLHLPRCGIHAKLIELTLGTCAGLPVAVELLKSIADKYDGVSYADLFQMASAQAIEVCLCTALDPLTSHWTDISHRMPLTC